MLVRNWNEFTDLPENTQIEQLSQIMTEIVNEAGRDFVYRNHNYSNCTYLKDDVPDCLIGRVLFRLGIPLEVLQEMDENIIAISSAEGPDLTGLSTSACDLLGVAQMKQDQGQNWGDALDTFLYEVKRKNNE